MVLLGFTEFYWVLLFSVHDSLATSIRLVFGTGPD